jgi:sugar phosphate isomerase/epimerase
MMKNQFSRRRFLQTSAVTASAAMIPGVALSGVNEKGEGNLTELNKKPLKIGLHTYNIGKSWDIETIIKNCTEAGWQSVELRTTHAHGVEVTLSAGEREAVKKRFEDSTLEKISLSSGFAYHFPDPAELKQNIEGTKEFTLLARDVGAIGVRVFPNALPEDVPEEKTIEQIAKALDEVCEFGFNNGVEIRVCVHGKGTNRVEIIKKIIDAAGSPHVYVNWNCDMNDMEGRGFEYNFNSIKDRIKGVHMHELWDPDYPYRLFFKLLAESGFENYCNCEIGRESCEPVEFMKYYKGLFLALQNAI